MTATPPDERAPARAASPCTGVCRIDAASGHCAGCLRTLEEIAAWGRLGEPARRAVLERLPARRLSAARAAGSSTST